MSLQFSPIRWAMFVAKEGQTSQEQYVFMNHADHRAESGVSPGPHYL
jgi:hypothetical protein